MAGRNEVGAIATTVAVISVASVGFMALTGRVDLRRAATVILGCCILFGASSIATGVKAWRGAEMHPDLPNRVIFAEISPLARPPSPQPG
jgi:type IV secretion system protein VirB2